MTREEAIQWLEAMKSVYALPIETYEAIDMAIEALKAQDRPKGKWILTEDDNYEYCTCSECGYENGENWMNGSDIPFCPNCGAKMDRERSEE